ncbi:proteasome activator complex subunit 4A-like [Onthophagus taurus]|uniref:proteasome activator complex subunit 4A-like n=1 Tax=Onthophagus taurus TaxID=166361 RepID=UPI000C1FE41A|nr:proteasome activator complex subunit 4A-like [Onthophagus taurus]
MENMEKDERFRKLGFIPQKENVYNKLLPYADKLDDESTKLFQQIKTNLIKSILAREMRPGCALWTSRLNRYLKIYGLKFSKEDHVILIKLFYELLTIPNLEPARISKFAVTLNLLLKKSYLLKQDDLQLEWRPLYDLCVRVLEQGKSGIGMYRYSSSLENSLENVIRAARLYFPVSATQEILDEFRPKMCPYSNNFISDAIGYLEVFLPVVTKPEEAHSGYNLWFEEFMNLWEVCHNANLWESDMAVLMGRLANFNIGYIDWEPYIPIMYVRFLRTLHLPVGYRKKQSMKLYKIDMSAMTLWIVATLGGGSEIAYFHLEKFMQTLDSYFHPANAGVWTMKIREFLRKISFYFVERVHRERYKKNDWRHNCRPSHNLTNDDIDRFVNILKPALEQAIFCKQGMQDIMLTLNYLAALRPEIIVPLTLEKLDASLFSVTEPHKLTSSMMSVVSVSRYMVQGPRNKYPDGPTHVIPLLMNILPGIDPNDMRKCFLTFNFIINFCTLCPLVNCSEASTYYDDLTEEEHIVCEQTADFENFLMQFLDKLFMWIESNSLEFTRMELSDQHFNDVKSKSEGLAENGLIQVMTAVLTQCPTDLFIMALKKTFNFATTRIMELNISAKLVATLCRSFSKVNAKETLKLFVPYLCTTFESLAAEHGDVKNEERLNGELLYNLLLLSEVVDGRGNLLPYIDDLTNILDQALYIKCTEANKTASHLLYIIVNSLSTITPEEYRSLTHTFDTPIKDSLTVRLWGCPGDLNNLNLKWYVPGEREVNTVEILIHKYLIPELEKMEKVSNGELILTRDDLRKSLKIVMALLGAQSLMPIWNDEPTLKLGNTCLELLPFQVNIGYDHEIKMPDGSNVRRAILKTIRKLQNYIQRADEGDTNSLKTIVYIYDVLLFNKYRGNDFEWHWKSFHLSKRTMEDRLHQNKKHMRHILIDRVMLHQEFRNETRLRTFTETHKEILLALFDLSVSRYSQVRSYAQSKLFLIVTVYPLSCDILTPYIKEILEMDSTEHHEKFKGCLYLLNGPKSTPMIARPYWGFLKELWPALVKSKPSEKISIVNLMSSIVDGINRHFPTLAIKIEMSEKSRELAHHLSKTITDFNLNGFQSHIDNGANKEIELVTNNTKIYNELLENLLQSIINGSLHWRHHATCLTMIQFLVHPDIKYNSNVIKYFLTASINDSIIIRHTAIRVVLYCMIQTKPKFLKTDLDPWSFAKTKKNKVIPGIRTDNEWLLYNGKTLPKNEESWNELRYVHDPYTGFYSWPKTLKVYLPPSEQPLFETRRNQMSEQEKEILDFFNNKDNVDTLIKFWSMEEKKGKDTFNMHRFSVIKNIFKIFDDSLLNLFIPHIERLVNDRQEHNQRCAAELLAGIIQGSKHWPFEKVEKLWSILLPIIRTAFNNMTDETVMDWSVCISVGLNKRDPNRLHWLLEYLMNDPLNEPTSFVSCSRIYLLQIALNQQPWRNSELINRLLEYFKNHLSHPFQNVREKISSCLVSLFCKDIVFPDGNFTNCPRVGDFFDQIMPKLNQLYTNMLKNLDHSNKVNSNDVEIATNRIEKIDLEDNKEEFIRLFKTVVKYVTGSVARMNYSAVTEHYNLLPLACILQSNDTDDELKNLCCNLLAILGCTIILNKYLPAALEAAKIVSKCPFWSARSVIAEFISVLVFHNMAIFVANNEYIMEVQSIILNLLEDVQPEVRIQAGKVLTGLLHCKFIPDPLKLLQSFKLKAKTKLKQSKSNLQSNGNQKSYSNESLSQRHAGVLGLCAFISAHPYDLPDYIPGIFDELGAHLNDPQPIPATIRKTLGDFKRTHYDNWEVHKLKFTEEELSVLSDLTVPPTYYA